MKKTLVAALIAIASVGAHAKSQCEQFADTMYNLANYRDHGHTKRDEIMYVENADATEGSKQETIRLINVLFSSYSDGRGADEIRRTILRDCTRER